MDVDTSIISSVQCHVEKIVERLHLYADGFPIEVRRMGSREYGCAEESSDLDLYLVIPDAWTTRAREIRCLLGAALEDAREAKDGADAPVDQTRNSTLKWTSTTYGLDVSLFVAVEQVVIDAVSATKCLASYFEQDNTARDTVFDTLVRLRQAGVLNGHGRKASVLQSLKTAPAALLCVALLKDYDPRATTDSQCMWLLRALSAFDATASCVRYNWTETATWCYQCDTPGSHSKGRLRILRNRTNSAERLSVPQWA